MNTTLEPEITVAELPPQEPAPKPKTKDEIIAQFLSQKRAEMNARLKGLDALAILMRRVPDSLLPKCSEHMCGLEFDHLTRDEAVIAMREMGGGKWEKSQNGVNPLALDYETHIDGIRVRLWAAAPPGTCRIVEEKVTIPASETTVRRLICA